MSRLLIAFCLLACTVLAGFAASTPPTPDAAMPAAATPAAVTPVAATSIAASPGTPGGGQDFDFLAGRWTAHNRRLVRPLDPAADAWEEFDSVHDGVLLPNGVGVADDFRIPSRPEFAGLALQLHDPATGQWRAYWYRNGVLGAPLAGRFVDGIGVFEGPDTHEGRPIRTRYTWSRITPRSARWEQAYSEDGGRTWETNWAMDYRRGEVD